MKKMIGWAMLAFAGLATWSSCSKDPLENLSNEESRIYITNRDSTANFALYKTYSIADSVLVVDNNSLSGYSTTAWDQQFLAALVSTMEARGYRRVNHTESPDLGISVSRLFNTTSHLVDLSDYWGNYGGYYDPYYWGYGGYGYDFPYYGIYESTEEALSVDMLDLRNAHQNGSIRGVWNGLIRGARIFDSNPANGVKALFDQSPYIKTVQ